MRKNSAKYSPVVQTKWMLLLSVVLADTILGSECIPYFESQKAEGKIKYVGFSFHGSSSLLRRLVSVRRWNFVQIQLNYYDWAYGDAKELYGILERENIPVMVMEPVRGGKLARLTPEADTLLADAEPAKSIASWAMRWLADLPQVAVVLSGMSDAIQVEDNIETFSDYKPLTESRKQTLMKACEIFRPTVSVVCTGCRYCCNDCPKELDIPTVSSYLYG